MRVSVEIEQMTRARDGSCGVPHLVKRQPWYSSIFEPAYGVRAGRRRLISPGACCSPIVVRESDGLREYTARMVELNCRTDVNPAAIATSDRGRSVDWMSIRAVSARCARGGTNGPAPRSLVNTPVR